MKLVRGHEWSAYAVVVGVSLSGIAWLLLHYYGRSPGEFGPQTNRAEPWSLRIHGAFAALALVLVGSLLTVHVAGALASRRHLVSGLSLLGLWSFLGLSGYLLYYTGDEELRAWISLLHWTFGLALPLLLGFHLAERRWRRP